jgi:hypothetical protein
MRTFVMSIIIFNAEQTIYLKPTFDYPYCSLVFLLHQTIASLNEA